MVGSLKYWNNGEPTLPDEGLGSLKYWINGEAYVVLTEETVGTNINSDRSAKISGKLTVTSERSAKICGGQTVYSKGVEGTLPADDTPLTQYTEQEVTDVGTDDNTFVDLDATSDAYAVHLFSEKNDAETEVGFNVSVKVKSTLAPSVSPVYLQVYNRTLEEWETLDSDGATDENTEFELSAYKGTDLSDYYDVDYVVSFRVYQRSTGVPI